MELFLRLIDYLLVIFLQPYSFCCVCSWKSCELRTRPRWTVCGSVWEHYGIALRWPWKIETFFSPETPEYLGEWLSRLVRVTFRLCISCC